MFITAMELKANESGEYEVAKGVSAAIFRAILVSCNTFYCRSNTEYGSANVINVD